MLIHNLLVSIRSFKRYRLSFVINLLGLTGGLVTAIFIYMWVAHELSVDKFHNDRIFRMVSDNGGNKTLLNTSSRFANELASAIPEIDLIVNSSWAPLQSGLTVDETTYSSIGEFGSSDFFNMFSYQLLSGDKRSLLDQPNGIVLSESTAKKLFGTIDVVGKSLEWRWYTALENVVVTGVFEDPPINSSARFDYVLTFKIFEKRFKQRIERGNKSERSFFMLKEGADYRKVNRKIAEYTDSNYPDRNPDLRPYFLIRYSDYYLYNNYENGEATGGRIVQVRMFTIIGILILIIACVNFMNMSTARAALRTKEIGVRKVMGARKASLIIQYLCEAILISSFAGLISLAIVVLLFPFYEQLIGYPMVRSLDVQSVISLFLIILITGLLAGIYPALYLSRFKPIQAIKGLLGGSTNDKWIRKGLVIFQFSVSLVLITAVLVVFYQLEYIQNKNLGYEKEFILNFRTSGMNRDKQQTFLSEARKIPGVSTASGITHAIFGAQRSGANITWKGKDPDINMWFEYGSVDYQMLELLEIEVNQGRFFSQEYSDERSKVVINEAMKATMQLENPIGEYLQLGDSQYGIIGVASDFHFQSLHEEIKPTFFLLNSGYSMKLAVKIHHDSMGETVKNIASLYEDINPAYPFEYSFHDQDQAVLYQTEEKVSSLSKYAAGLAIFISSLGLFGLMSYVTERKAKEMSIRKVLGATSRSLITLLSIDFLIPLGASIILGVSLSAFSLNIWLDQFAYRIHLEWWFFAFSILIMIGIITVTISSQMRKTLNLNPVDSLKEE
ncbi:ABC transporter permease [Ekhidna sp.]